MAITKTIKNWIFNTFFSDKVELVNSLREEKSYWELKHAEMKAESAQLQQEYEAQKALPKPKMSDLMRDMLGLYTINIADVNKQGLPAHPLDAPKQIRDHRIAQLATVFTNETFQILCNYLVDVQGNFMVRTANGDTQLSFGRGSINGIETIRSELSKAQMLYEEANSPPEEYDEHAPI